LGDFKSIPRVNTVLGAAKGLIWDGISVLIVMF
jgi:hypothetical protein